MIKKNILFCVIGTGKKYYDMAINLINSLNKYALKKHNVNILLFTDQIDPNIKNTKVIYTKQMGWPGPTLFRYRILSSVIEEYIKYDYIYYIDADMELVDYVDEEILGELVGVNHVGWFDKDLKEAPFERSIFSKAYIPYDKEQYYYHATFFGASRNQWLKMILTIKDYIDIDCLNGFLTTTFWDEAFLNRYFNIDCKPTVLLSPSYAFFYKWRNDAPFKPKIMNIEKNDTEEIKKIRGTYNNFLYDFIVKYNNQEKYDLLNTTFVFFYKEDSYIRESHLKTELEYLNKYFDTNFLIIKLNENNTLNLKYNNLNIIEFKDNLNFNFINYISSIKNYVNTEYVCIHDIDSVIAPHNYILSRFCLEYFDYVYPHNGVRLYIESSEYYQFQTNLDISKLDLSDQIHKYQYSRKWLKKGFLPLFIKKDRLDSLHYNFNNELDINTQNGIIYDNIKSKSHYFTSDFIGHFSHASIKFENYIYENKDNGKILIIVSAFNSKKYITQTLRYLLNQTYENYSILLIDDGSTDGSKIIYKEIKKKYSDKFNYFLKEKNEGAYSARNKGLELIKSISISEQPKYILFHDSDDLSSPHKLSILSNFLENNREYDFVGSIPDFIDSYDNELNIDKFTNHDKEYRYELNYKKIKNDLYVKNNFYFSGVLFKYNSIKNFEFKKIYYNEDFEFISNLIFNNKKCCNIYYVLNKYRIRKDSKSGTKTFNYNLQSSKIIEKNMIQLLKEKKNKKNIGVIVIGTNKYKDLAKNTINSIKQYFLKFENVTIYLFTDDVNYFNDCGFNVIKVNIKHLQWPYITLLRYKIINEHIRLFKNEDYLFYIDADMKIVDYINDEILEDTVTLLHPYYYKKTKQQFTYERNPISEAYISENEGKHYYQACFFGGTTKKFLDVSLKLDYMTFMDLFKYNYIPVWYDESYFNKYFYLNEPKMKLDPSYGTPDIFKYSHELNYLNRFTPKIITISKNNDSLREKTRGKDWGFIHKQENLTDKNKRIQNVNINMDNLPKYDLMKCTFIIPVFIDSVDRLDNLNICVNYLNKYFNTNIFIGEMSKKYILDKKFSNKNNIQYFKIKPDKKYEFHRTYAINYMIKESKTPIISIYDSDVFLEPLQYINAYNEIISDKADMVIPYNGKFNDIKRNNIPTFKNKLNIDYLKENSYSRYGLDSDYKGVGGAIFVNKESYCKAGMENEKFITWGCEDQERVERMKLLDYKVNSLDGEIYHINHIRKLIDTPENESEEYKNNVKEFHKIKSMSKTELENYIKKWNWLKHEN